MTWSAILLVAAFLALWLGPMILIGRIKGRGSNPAAAIGIAGGLYMLAFFVLAAWWRPPFFAERAVESAAASWAAAPGRPFDCNEVQAGAAALGRVSQGRIEATAAGHLRMSGDLWQRLPERQRATLMALAVQIRRCLGGGSGRDFTISDIETNRLLHRGE